MDIIHELSAVIKSQLDVIKTFLSLATLEAKLARLSLLPLLLGFCLFLMAVMIFWLSGTVLIGFVIMYSLNSLWMAIIGVFLMNAIIVGGLFYYLLFNLKCMSFEKTRAFIFQAYLQERQHDGSTKATDA